MPSKRRLFKIEERVREVVSALFNRMSDPRFGLVTITTCTATPDARLVKIYWTASGPRERVAEIEEAFKGATSYFRRGVADELRLRFAPDLKFYYDNTMDVMQEVHQLLERIK